MSVELSPRDIDPVSVALAHGPRVTLRAVRVRDFDSLRTLALKAGLLCDELELARLVRSDPAVRLVLCAGAVVDGSETVLGVGVIELGQSATMPSLLLVDAELTSGLAQRLADALVERARALAIARPA